MNIKQLKKELEPWIRSIVRQELKKKEMKSGLLSDEQMDQALKNAQRAMNLLQGFGFGKKEKKDENKMKVEWQE